MKTLYIFPHPDDESFGPAAVMHRQLKNGEEVYLLTLTKGGATKQRFKLGLSVEEMGEVRYKEMLDVKETLGLTAMEVLDFPDSGLKEMDPREIEIIVKAYIKRINPDIIVSYPVHGVSGFHDHLVMHAVIKRVFLELRDEVEEHPKRLAMLTLPDNGAPPFNPDGSFRMKNSEEELIDCVVTLEKDEINMLKDCLKCYATYQDTIEKSGVIEKIGNKIYFEFFDENYDPPVSNLTDGL